MKHSMAVLWAALGLLVTVGAAAQNINVRGTVTAFDGKSIAVKTREGKDISVAMADDTTVSTARPLKLSDLKMGQVVAVTTIKRPSDGATVAIDVRPISATARQGLSPYDLQPNSTMTNATLEATVQSAGGQELTLNYQTGTVKVLVPEGTPMSQAGPGERSDIKPGAVIFLVAKPGSDGGLIAVRAQVSKDGVNPTQ
jgi:hypothetical protein